MGLLHLLLLLPVASALYTWDSDFSVAANAAGVTVDASGNFYIALSTTTSIEVWNSAHVYQNTITAPGIVLQVHWDSLTGDLFACYYANTIHQITTAGASVATFTSSATGICKMIAVDNGGGESELWVGSGYNTGIQYWDFADEPPTAYDWEFTLGDSMGIYYVSDDLFYTCTGSAVQKVDKIASLDTTATQCISLCGDGTHLFSFSNSAQEVNIWDMDLNFVDKFSTSAQSIFTVTACHAAANELFLADRASGFSYWTSTGGAEDPHFVGFNGQKFDFAGADGEVFNIVSSPEFQFNALFTEYPTQSLDGGDSLWFTQFSFQVAEHSIVIDTDSNILVDGEISDAVVAFDQLSMQITPSGVIAIKTEQFIVEVIANDQGHLEWCSEGCPHLDFSLYPTVPVSSLSTEGILGSTWSYEGVKEIDGSAYRVRDGILGRDFPANQF